MFLENIVVDAVDPLRLGRFWEAVVAGERLTDEPDGLETRLTVPGGPVLDLCFQRVAEPVDRAAETAPGPRRRSSPGRGGRPAARTGCPSPRRRSGGPALGRARRPEGNP